MSATTAQPITGQANQSAPFGALAILVGALALGAVGIAIGQGYKSAPAAGVPADLQGVHAAQQVGGYNAAPAAGVPADLQGVHAAQQVGEKGFPGSISGPTTGAQKGLGGATDESAEISPARSGHHRR